jgi:hypothetical protein
MTLRERFEGRMRAFVDFAILEPNATKTTIRRRSRIVSAATFAFVVPVVLGFAFTDHARRDIVEKAAIALQRSETCERTESKTLTVCLDAARWRATDPEVQSAWLAGQAYVHPSLDVVQAKAADGSVLFRRDLHGQGRHQNSP